jgi:hypothetical protein
MPSASSITISGLPAFFGGAVLLGLAITMLAMATPTPHGEPARFIRGWVTAYSLIFTALFSLGVSALLTSIGTAGRASLPLAIGLGLTALAALAWRIVRRRRRRAATLVVNNPVSPEPERPSPASITDEAA